jgi:hypothetical protein
LENSFFQVANLFAGENPAPVAVGNGLGGERRPRRCLTARARLLTLARPAPFASIFYEPVAVHEPIRDRAHPFVVWETAEIYAARANSSAKPSFEASDAQVVRPTQSELVLPEFWTNHVVLTDRNYVDTTIVALVPREFLAGDCSRP